MANCGVCGKRIPLLEGSLQMKDGKVCCECILKNDFTLLHLNNYYLEEAREILCENFVDWTKEKKRKEQDVNTKKKELARSFKSTSTKFDELEIDENNKIIRLLGEYYQFDQIQNYELYEDNSTIMKGGLGRALVGDVLLGAGGAFLGAMTRKSSNVCQKMEIVVNVYDDSPIVQTITLINDNVKRDSEEYSLCLNKARQMMFMLDIVNKGKENEIKKENNSNSFSVADEIKKFKLLLDDGVITKEEFEKKKKQLLDL